MHATPRLLPRPTFLVLLALAGLASAGCDGSSTAAGTSDAPPAERPVGDHDREIRDLVTAVTALSPDATAIQERDWYARRKETLERLRRADRAFGLAALEAYSARARSPREVRAALLDVAAHTAPDATAPILVALVTTYGDDLGLRRSAAELLGRTAPEEAVRVLEPIVVETERDATYPPTEALLAACVEAMVALGMDPTALCADVATDMRQDEAARHRAIKELGRRPATPRARQALEIVLVESMGNSMARRFAAQSLRDALPKEELCPVLQRVFDNESDLGFQQFLASMLEERCR